MRRRHGTHEGQEEQDEEEEDEEEYEEEDELKQFKVVLRTTSCRQLCRTKQKIRKQPLRTRGGGRIKAI